MSFNWMPLTPRASNTAVVYSHEMKSQSCITYTFFNDSRSRVQGVRVSSLQVAETKVDLWLVISVVDPIWTTRLTDPNDFANVQR
jgi:hypothetical protein